MNRYLIVFLILLIAILGCGDTQQTGVEIDKVPQWVYMPSSDSTALHAVGTGESLMEALTNGLGDLSGSISTTVLQDKHVSSVAYNNLKVKMTVKEDDSTSGSKAAKVISYNIQLSYQDNESSLNYRIFVKESSRDGKSSFHRQIEGQFDGIDTWKFIDLLENEDIKVVQIEQQQKVT